MGIVLNWATTNEDDNPAPRVQVFYESSPIQSSPDADILIQNVVPGRAYRIKELLSARGPDSNAENWSEGLTTNAYRDYFYWPVSNLDSSLFTRYALVSNVDIYPHHSRVSANVYAIRFVTRPSSATLAGFTDQTLSFSLFLESNIDTLTSVHVGLSESNVLTYDSYPVFVDLGYDYEFDNSDHFPIYDIQLVDNNENVLASTDESGVLRFTLDSPALVGTDIYVQQMPFAQTNPRPVMRVRDGRKKKSYTELGTIAFSELFSNEFKMFVFETQVDPTYDKYDAFVTMRTSSDLYITSHMYAHTLEMRSYPRPTTIVISQFDKNADTVHFQFPDDYKVGLVFDLVRDVSLHTMYQRIIYG